MSSDGSSIPCFDRGGNQDLDLHACSLNGTYPQCCEPTQLCASNGLCAHRNQGGAYTPYVIGGCIDSDWSDEGCVSECKDIGYGVGVCSNLGPGYFCCYGTSGCNCTSTSSPGVFRKVNVQFIASLSSDGSLPATTSADASTSLSSMQSSITSLPSTSSSVNRPAASQTSESNSSGDDNTMELGLGLGLGLGIPLLIVIGALVWLFRRRRSRENAEQVAMMTEQSAAASKRPGAYSDATSQPYSDPQYGYGGGQNRSEDPQELDASQYARTELDSTTSASGAKSMTNRSPLLS